MANLPGYFAERRLQKISLRRLVSEQHLQTWAAIATILSLLLAIWLVLRGDATPGSEPEHLPSTLPLRQESGIVVKAKKNVIRMANGVNNEPVFLFDRPPDRLTPPSTPLKRPEEKYRWAYENGGIDAWVTSLELKVFGNSEEPVFLEDVRVVVQDCRVPASGYVVDFGDQEGDPVDMRIIHGDLDHRQPKSRSPALRSVAHQNTHPSVA